MSTIDMVNVLNCFIRNEKYSTCRLCLGVILDEYVPLDQNITVGSNETKPLSEMLQKVIGDDVLEAITGLEAVCTECAETALMSIQFINKCKTSNNTINALFESLSHSLNLDLNIQETDKNKMLYLILNGPQSQAVIEETKEIKSNECIPGKYFECVECDEIFTKSFHVKAHNMIKHNAWTCEICFEMFSTQEDLVQHEDSTHTHKCPHCSTHKNCKQSLREHMDKFHTAYVCQDCGKTCQGLDKLKSHEIKHKTKSTCPKCGKSYTTKDFYLRHVELCLKDMIDPHPIRSKLKRSFTCQKCDKAYSTPGGLRVHDRFVHGNARPHVCKECGKEFTAPSSLKIHMIKHTGEKNYQCDICSNKFVSKEALLYHTRRHTGEKPYSCEICNERFVNASARAEHIKFKHVGPTLMCEICSRKFVTAHFLKQHISRHHDPSSTLYSGRSIAPSNLPLEQNMRKFIINAKTS